MITINLNDKVCTINERASIKELLDMPILKQLPIASWANLLKQKDGIVLPKTIKTVLSHNANEYGNSDTVDAFLFNGKQYWFDKNTRVSLQALVSVASNTINLVLGDEILEVNTDNIKKFLIDLELYANKCFVTTAKHNKSIKELFTLEDMINYDYTCGYPNKLNLNEYLDLA